MVRIYTKGGDHGTTSLFGGRRVDKNSLRIRAYGEVDELNSLIGMVIADLRHSRLDPRFLKDESRILDSRIRGNDNRKQLDDIAKKLLRVQAELFVLGTDLATPDGVKVSVPRITKSFVTRLEKEIDKWSRTLPQLKKFILPGGGKTGSKLHLARTVARRAERAIVDLSGGEKVNKTALIYINRLSDWLFVLARYVNKLSDQSEKIWQGRAKT